MKRRSGFGRRKHIAMATAAVIERLEARTLLSTFTVSNSNDSGTGSLRQAILNANASPGADSISVNLSSSATLTLQSALPAITEAAALSSVGYGVLTLSGSSLPAGSAGLVLTGNGISVSRLTLMSFGNGVVSSGTGNSLSKCTIVSNQIDGVRTLGGTLAISTCGIAANAGMNIDVGGDGPTPNDNPDVDGVANYPVLTSATWFSLGAYNNYALVQGTFQGPPNKTVTIETFTGIQQIMVKTIITDASGFATFGGILPSPNGSVYAIATYDGRTSEFSAPMATKTGTGIPLGVVTSAADSGTGSLRQAILACNAHPGRDAIYFDFGFDGSTNTLYPQSPLPDVTDPVVVDGQNAYFGVFQNVRIDGEYAGASADGLHLLGGNSPVDNLLVTGFQNGIVIGGAGGTTLSGTVGTFQNRGDGIRVLAGEGNRIEAQSAYNGGMAIDLGGDGPTPNDPFDLDTGPNQLQNYPDVSSAQRNGTNVVVRGTVSTAPGTYRINFYAYPKDAPAFFSAPTFSLGTASVTVDITGQASFAFTYKGTNVTNLYGVIATATDINGNTSEASAAVPVTYAPFVVTSASDSGPGTLRQALLDINARATPGAVSFAIPGAGVHRINVASALPVMAQSITIDGTSEPGYAGTPVIEIAGPGGAAFDGLTFNAIGSEARALSIGGFKSGIVLAASDSDVRGCYVGIDSAALPLPDATGIELLSTRQTVGGTNPGDGNVISGNSLRGIHLGGNGIETVAGNLIGTDPSGTRAVPNAIGIEADYKYVKGTIGGTVAAARNVISGNTTAGIHYISTDWSGSAYIQGNYIGTDVTGEQAVPNGAGINLDNLQDGTGLIGGSVAAAGNIISGNTGAGILSNNEPYIPIQGNRIGLTPSGRPLGNGGDGIFANAPSSGSLAIGATAAGAANIIAYNGGNGVVIASGTLATVRVNSIYSNGKLGIDIGNNGVTASGITLTAAALAGSPAQLTLTIAGAPSNNYTLDLYTSPTADPSGFGEGRTYLGSYWFTTSSSGTATMTLTPPAPINAFISAIVVGASSTSEFTNAISVAGAAVSVSARSLFYNDSAFDWTAAADKNGNGLYDPGEDGGNDDAAVATDKSALLPGQTATTANFTSSLRGINGVAVDVANLASRTLAASDFTFKAGNTADPSTWSAAPSPAGMSVRDFAGANGSDRIELIWADGSIVNEWLQVTVNATANTGLASPDVFYFGNLVGDASGNGVVTSADVAMVKSMLGQTATVTSAADLNRNGQMTSADVAIAKAYVNQALTMLAAPLPAPAPAAAYAAPLGLNVTAAPTPAPPPPQAPPHAALPAPPRRRLAFSTAAIVPSWVRPLDRRRRLDLLDA